MKITFRFFAILAFCLMIHSVDAQRILLVEKPGKFKNYKYTVGDEITVRIAPYGEKHNGTIHEVTDTSILINFDNEIMLEDIEMVIRPRWGLNLLSKITRIAGAGYFILDVVNNSITGSPTIVDKNTVMISAGLVAFSYVLVPFHDKRMKNGEKWRIKVLNMSMDEDVPNPFRQ
ncbi:MAG: hypothetical protein KAR09_07425 [Bacteroidales bacterium]|nr:hypothetical protein [Bacteroidales bacterium]